MEEEIAIQNMERAAEAQAVLSDQQRLDAMILRCARPWAEFVSSLPESLAGDLNQGWALLKQIITEAYFEGVEQGRPKSSRPAIYPPASSDLLERLKDIHYAKIYLDAAIDVSLVTNAWGVLDVAVRDVVEARTEKKQEAHEAHATSR